MTSRTPLVRVRSSDRQAWRGGEDRSPVETILTRTHPSVTFSGRGKFSYRCSASKAGQVWYPRLTLTGHKTIGSQEILPLNAVQASKDYELEVAVSVCPYFLPYATKSVDRPTCIGQGKGRNAPNLRCRRALQPYSLCGEARPPKRKP